MKKILIIICAGITSFTYAQTKKPVAAKKTVIEKKALPVFKTSLDSFSYAIGVEGASYYKSQGAEGINC
jgi:hypothetical protein